MTTDAQPAVTGRFVKRLREQAKAMNRAPGIGHCHTLNMVAHEAGFKDWPDVIRQHNALVARQAETEGAAA